MGCKHNQFIMNTCIELYYIVLIWAMNSIWWMAEGVRWHLFCIISDFSCPAQLPRNNKIHTYLYNIVPCSSFRLMFFQI